MNHGHPTNFKKRKSSSFQWKIVFAVGLFTTSFLRKADLVSNLSDASINYFQTSTTTTPVRGPEVDVTVSTFWIPVENTHHILLTLPPPQEDRSCTAIAASAVAGKWNFRSLLDQIPRFVSRIDIDLTVLPDRCQEYYEESGFLTSLQVFLQQYFPLSRRLHVLRGDGNTNDDSRPAGGKLVQLPTEPSYTSAAIVDQLDTQFDCRSVRGRFGTWEYDSVYANASYYTDGNWILGTENVDGPYPHSSYVWRENETSCEMDLLTKDGLCTALNTLNISRIMVLGDSMEFMRLKSFFHIINGEDYSHYHLRPRYKMRYTLPIDCLDHQGISASNNTIQIVFYHVNHVMPLLGEKYASSTSFNTTSTSPPVDPRFAQMVERQEAENLDKGVTAQYFVCYGVRKMIFPDKDGNCPWATEYLNFDDSKRTLVLAGVGPHFHHLPLFQEQMDRFMSLLQEHNRPQDIIWLRTVTPGHRGCGSLSNPKPLSTFGQFHESYYNSTLHDWNLFPEYNRYMERLVLHARQQGDDWKGPTMDLLDIYWMSSLRHDGHPSSIDCMHYLLPGPPDWWNHLLYSKLRDLANL